MIKFKVTHWDSMGQVKAVIIESYGWHIVINDLSNKGFDIYRIIKIELYLEAQVTEG
jgi:hypothetical protein